jgi:hypothetical protein
VEDESKAGGHSASHSCTSGEATVHGWTIGSVKLIKADSSPTQGNLPAIANPGASSLRRGM